MEEFKKILKPETTVVETSFLKDGVWEKTEVSVTTFEKREFSLGTDLTQEEEEEYFFLYS